MQAYNDKMYVRAQVISVNSGGYIMHPIGNQNIELFCFYKMGQRGLTLLIRRK